MFYIDVAKVDRDVAFVAMVIHVCLKFLIEEWKTHALHTLYTGCAAVFIAYTSCREADTHFTGSVSEFCFSQQQQKHASLYVFRNLLAF